MTKKILVIVIVVIALLLMATPVSAVVKPPTTVKDALLKGIWGAIMDLQNQITALTKKVDGIQTNPMPEYRAGSYTTPLEDYPIWGSVGSGVQTVSFSHPMPNTNYRVIVTNADISQFSLYNCDMCILTIDSKTTTSFTFSFRNINDVGVGVDQSVFPIHKNHKFDYIAIADN